MNDNELLEMVLKAVKGVNNGKSNEFNSLVNELRKKPLDETLFCAYLHAMRKAIKYMNKQHETMIGVILTIDWATYQVDTVALFIEFLSELISAKTYYVKVCIRSLIKQFSPKTEVFDDDLTIFKRKCDHIHTALQTIVHLAPLSTKYLSETVKNYFPYTGKGLFVLESYIVHILQLTVYAADTRFEILQLLIDKLISVDVHVQRNELEQENEKVKMKGEFQFEFEEKGGNASSDENVCKLDQLMTILFAYIDSVSFINNTLDYSHAELLVKDMLLIFENVVLKTQSSHVQFLLFYMASFHKNFALLFIDTCWKILQDPNYTSVLRQASACYLSSFLARAKFVEKDIIKDQMKRLSEWIHRYIDFQDESTIRAGKKRHAPFYSACQALFYIFLYHYKLLLESSNDIKFMKSINLVRIVTSRLNPLKFCLDSVVSMFARITRMYQIVFCYSIIERNSRMAVQQLNAKKETTSGEDLDRIFFPFDPYMLPKSSKWIDPLYIQWNISLNDESEDEDEDASDGGETSDLDLEVVKNMAISSSSFDMICISPGFQFLSTNGN